MLDMKVFILFVSFIISRTISENNIDRLDIEVEHQCIQHCPLQNRTDGGHYDYSCNYDCNIEQCAKGCKLWRKALNSSCEKTCNGLTRLTQKELRCVMGCNDAITTYFMKLRTNLGTPPAPALVADSLNATNLKLEWDFPEARTAGLSCHIQWKYEELAATWQFCANSTWNPDKSMVVVENLQPYTKYRFRVVLILELHGDQIESAPSSVIITHPFGVPASPPLIVRAAAVDCTRISVRWEPGPFPHGPLLSYNLQITDNYPEVHSEVKDIPPETKFHVFRNLRSSRNYTISINMRNGVGSGPPATVLVSTPPEPSVNDTQLPMLILGTEESVIEQGTDLRSETVVLYKLRTIKGLAIHISKELVFVSDSNGYVKKVRVAKKKQTTDILVPTQINFRPQDLTMDWLNNQLYILGEVKFQQQPRWQIARCNLDGSGLTVAVAGLTVKPHTIEVDPYNGYLFWVEQGILRGLYRLDISDISNGIKHDVRPEQILQEPNLGAFTVDHTNFRLLVANQNMKTIYAVSLDGKEITNLRERVKKSKLEKVVSLATANKTFYWTDGDKVYYEEYHKQFDSYFHNSYAGLLGRRYNKIIINLPSSQPIPVPVNPPTNVQAIFGNNVAKIAWNAPHLLGIQGKGAWQNWSYEVELKETTTNKILTYRNISTTSAAITKLNPNTEYIVKVAAYTSFGSGPWSTEFKGITLSKSKNPFILWSAAEGLLRSDATGENMEVVIPQSNIKNFYFTDITWYQDQIYLVSNNSHVYLYNLTTHKQDRLIDNDSVGSIAIDWVGKKLYWSNPQQQLIIRGNLNGTQQEPLPLLTIAKVLSIDSVKAYIYWATVHTVECARLNGADRMKYHELELFSTKRVMGLTLDMDHKYVYWIVRGSEGSNLFRAPMAGYWPDKKIFVEQYSSLQKPNMHGSLCYFHNHFLWLQDDSNAAISDLEGKNIATISGNTMSHLSMAYIIDQTLHVVPDTDNSFDDITVIPDVVDKNSIKVVGSASNFNITWKQVTNVNYGQVFYEMQIDSITSHHNSTVSTTVPSIKYWQEIAPFTKLHIAIRAFTYWGTSPQIHSEIFSPPSTPSAPMNLRAYVTHDHIYNNEVSATVRWDEPLYPNGIIRGYKIYCWYFEDNEKVDLCSGTILQEKENVARPLKEDVVYYFQVQAFTEIGDGTLSNSISINSSRESPIPTLLIASSDSIFIQDIDTNKNYSLMHGINTPIEISYLKRDKKIFWLNQMQELLMYHIDKDNKSKIFDINGNAKSLTIDWLERSLYYIETIDAGSTVFKIDLNHLDKGIVDNIKILETPSEILKIEISPFTKKLYWVESQDDINYTLMKSDKDGCNIEPFFPKLEQNLRKKRDEDEDDGQIKNSTSCTCDFDIDIEKTFAIDHSNINKKPLLIFIDRQTQNVMSADKDGCFCNIIANNTVVYNSLPLDRIKSDFGNLYWTNPTHGLLYALKREESNVLTKEVNVHDIMIFGTHMQPYPRKECLSPKQGNFTVSLKRKTSNTLLLEMPEIVIHDFCENISIATIEYRIYYTEIQENILACNEHCVQFVTFDKELLLDDLKPFTKYVVSVSVSNHFTENNEVIIGPPVVFQTAPGAPSKPQNISATVLNPTIAEVVWSPPEHLNGKTVFYEIHWQTDITLSGVRQKGEQLVADQENFNASSNYLKALLHKLSPNETYTIWVRAYCETNETSSDSDKIQIKTYPEPSDFILINKTAYVLRLEWLICKYIKSYVVQYAPITSNEWSNITIKKEFGVDTIPIVVNNLKPKTQYKFRLLLWYEKLSGQYIWPSDSRFTYETLGDKPSPPGVPIIQYAKPNIYKVWWEASKENGAPIEMYTLEYLQLPNYRAKRSTVQNRTAWSYLAPSVEEAQREWKSVYNGTDTSWIINGLDEKFKYSFRATAFNSYGWSNPSSESSEFDFNETARMAESGNQMKNILIGMIPISIGLIILITCVCFICMKKCGKKKKVQQVVAIPRRLDVELATLRELPRRGVHNTNILYVAAQPTAAEISLLPHIRRDQITLTKFLGSGAFGEVFEGKAKNIQEYGEMKVAVKTLRKGASDQEKSEFLQEAQLMSHFKHEHILQLLGVCLDNDPNFIIMELMQCGDLLTYLRSSRKSVTNPQLTLRDLLKMCVDVAKGCRYLEEMHFVHRDLACRNCLVSSNDPDNRIVKIGDFGLARDIYKNDYYRKEGEGLLPVRWMAPESLVDGVFTSQSDVWAFGVLLWEIMTLGQQPYPARNNLEVLHYVRGGGRLGKPIDCPEALHGLMLECWESDPEKRPTFKYCLEILEKLHLDNLRNPITGAHEGQYISTVPDQFYGISNAAYFRDENHNSGTSWKSEQDDESNKEKTPFLTQKNDPTSLQEIPKYLELLYDPEPVLENDGYEIPNDMLPNRTITTTEPNSIKPCSSSSSVVTTTINNNLKSKNTKVKNKDVNANKRS